MCEGQVSIAYFGAFLGVAIALAVVLVLIFSFWLEGRQYENKLTVCQGCGKAFNPLKGQQYCYDCLTIIIYRLHIEKMEAHKNADRMS